MFISYHGCVGHWVGRSGERYSGGKWYHVFGREGLFWYAMMATPTTQTTLTCSLPMSRMNNSTDKQSKQNTPQNINTKHTKTWWTIFWQFDVDRCTPKHHKVCCVLLFVKHHKVCCVLLFVKHHKVCCCVLLFVKHHKVCCCVLLFVKHHKVYCVLITFCQTPQGVLCITVCQTPQGVLLCITVCQTPQGVLCIPVCQTPQGVLLCIPVCQSPNKNIRSSWSNSPAAHNQDRDKNCLLAADHPSNMLVYLGKRSAQTIVCAATLRWKLQIKFSTSPSHSILTLGQPVPVLTR